MYKATFKDNRKFNGTYLSVRFKDGQGETNSPYLADRLKDKGLLVTKELEKKPLSKMNLTELEALAAELNVDISGGKNKLEKTVLLQATVEAGIKDGAQFVCDQSDAGPTINQAMQALGTAGGTVVLRAGNYSLYDRIEVPTRVAIKGIGQRSTIISANDDIITFEFKSPNATLENSSIYRILTGVDCHV
ncbi:MAG: hypothetical protein ACOYJC_06345 [Christensenellales bacterium]|jgi:hypothetical protein